MVGRTPPYLLDLFLEKFEILMYFIIYNYRNVLLIQNEISKCTRKWKKITKILNYNLEYISMYNFQFNLL